MRADPHSHADLEQGRVVHLAWAFAVDFSARTLTGEATLTLDHAASGPLDLDSRGLIVEGACTGDGTPLQTTTGPSDAVLGERLRIDRPTPTDTVRIRYRTSPEATALMWLEPSQTSAGTPFLLSQCQAIHARSIVPLQDTPRARITYEASVEVPRGMSIVMSAAPGDQADGRWTFRMPQAIPPYLLALAVGRLEHRDLGPRTRVYAEPEVVEAAAWEFAQVEDMLCAAESLFGPYRWERYDAIVLPPSFPMGGMENPRMTFLTPTLVAGDRSLVNVLAHELAHSWTGNLVTNATNEHFWLNEGWTVYAERRILEVLEGPDAAQRAAALARVRLDDVLARRAQQGRPTALTYDQRGLDPDEEFSVVPYEKGFLLLVAIERAVGRERFDPFVQAYIERFAFLTLTTDDFVRFLDEHLPDHGIALDPWLHADGLPHDAPSFDVPALTALADAARALPSQPMTEWPAPSGVDETLWLLGKLPVLDAPTARTLAARLGLDSTRNAELESAWLALAIRSHLPTIDPQIEAFVGRVGRTKLLVPVFRALVAGGRGDWAAELVDLHQRRWHISTRQALQAVIASTDPIRSTSSATF